MATLAEEFEAYRDRPFVFVCPGGNFGDHLIWLGAETLAQKMGIRFERVDFDHLHVNRFNQNHVLYIHGGGGYNSWASGRVAAAFTKSVLQHRGVVIQGPQTFEISEQYADSVFNTMHDKTVAQRIVLFVRERTSLDFLRSAAPRWCEVQLDVDTAFHNDRATLIQQAGRVRSRFDLLACRIDNEKPEAGPPVHLPRAVRLDPARFARSFQHWLRIHADARNILTNRTHSAVIGALLGKQTTMFGGAYHKNRSLWDFTLQAMNVQWLDQSTHSHPPIKGPSRLHRAMDRAARRSWKLNRLLYRFQGVPLS